MPQRIECRKFSPNIFNKQKCSVCFKCKEEHSSDALISNKALRKVQKCGFMFLAPEWDFTIPRNRSKRWQRRWFVLYDDGELTYAIDDHSETIPQGVIDLSKIVEVINAEDITGNVYSFALTSTNGVTFIKTNSREESQWWMSSLNVYVTMQNGIYKRNLTFSGRSLISSVQDNKNQDTVSMTNVSNIIQDNNRDEIYGERPIYSESPPTHDNLDVNERKDVHIGSNTRHSMCKSIDGEQIETDLISNNYQAKFDRLRRCEKLKNIADSLTQMSISRAQSKSLLDINEFPTRDVLYENELHSHNAVSRSISHAEIDVNPGGYIDLKVNLPSEDLLVYKKGWLLKLNSLHNEWLKHWFVMRDSALYYYRNIAAEEDQFLDGHIDLTRVQHVCECDSFKAYGFYLCTWDQQKYYLAALTSGIRFSWIEALRNEINNEDDAIINVMDGCKRNARASKSSLSSEDEYKTLSEDSSPDEFLYISNNGHLIKPHEISCSRDEKIDTNGNGIETCFNSRTIVHNGLSNHSFPDTNILTKFTYSPTDKFSTKLATETDSCLHTPIDNSKNKFVIDRNIQTNISFTDKDLRFSPESIVFSQKLIAKQKNDLEKLNSFCKEQQNQYEDKLLVKNKEIENLKDRLTILQKINNESKQDKSEIYKLKDLVHELKSRLQDRSNALEVQKNLSSQQGALCVANSEINNLKRMLSSSEQAEDSVHIQLCKVKQEYQENEYRNLSEIDLMSKRIKDLANKLFLSEKKVTELQDKLNISERIFQENSFKERRRSCSLKRISASKSIDNLHKIKDGESTDLADTKKKTIRTRWKSLDGECHFRDRLSNHRTKEKSSILKSTKSLCDRDSSSESCQCTCSASRVRLKRINLILDKFNEDLCHLNPHDSSIISAHISQISTELESLSANRVDKSVSALLVTRISKLFSDTVSRLSERVDTLCKLSDARSLHHVYHEYRTYRHILFTALTRAELISTCDHTQRLNYIKLRNLLLWHTLFAEAKDKLNSCELSIEKLPVFNHTISRLVRYSNINDDGGSMVSSVLNNFFSPYSQNSIFLKSSDTLIRSLVDSLNKVISQVEKSLELSYNSLLDQLRNSTIVNSNSVICDQIMSKLRLTLYHDVQNELLLLQHLCKIDQCIHYIAGNSNDVETLSNADTFHISSSILKHTCQEQLGITAKSLSSVISTTNHNRSTTNSDSFSIQPDYNKLCSKLLSLLVFKVILISCKNLLNEEHGFKPLSDRKENVKDFDQMYTLLKIFFADLEFPTDFKYNNSIIEKCAKEMQDYGIVFANSSDMKAFCEENQATVASLRQDYELRMRRQRDKYIKYLKSVSAQPVVNSKVFTDTPLGKQESSDKKYSRYSRRHTADVAGIILTENSMKKAATNDSAFGSCLSLTNSGSVTCISSNSSGCRKCSELRFRIDTINNEHTLELKALRKAQDLELSNMRNDIYEEFKSNIESYRVKNSELEQRLKLMQKRLECLECEYSRQTEVLREQYQESCSVKFDDVIVEENIRQRYQSEIEQLKGLCEKGLVAMESSHKKIISDLAERHRQEIDSLRADKQKALAEETQATMAALEVLRKAHQQEVQREVTKFKQEFAKRMQPVLDLGKIQQEHSAEMEDFKAEILGLSEKYSIKCLEVATLEEKVEALLRNLQQTKRNSFRLDARNKYLQAQLNVNINELSCETGGDRHLQLLRNQLAQSQDLARKFEEELDDAKQREEEIAQLCRQFSFYLKAERQLRNDEVSSLKDRLEHIVLTSSRCSSADKSSVRPRDTPATSHLSPEMMAVPVRRKWSADTLNNKGDLMRSPSCPRLSRQSALDAVHFPPSGMVASRMKVFEMQ